MEDIPGGPSLSVVEGMTLRGWGTQRGLTLRDMYLSVGVFVGRGTQEALTLRNMYLTVGVFVEICKFLLPVMHIFKKFCMLCAHQDCFACRQHR